MSAYLIENIGNALQEAAKTTSSVIHSDNKIIRYAINYAIKSSMNSIMKDRDFINSESAFKTVAGAGAGAIIGSLSPEHEKFAGDVIEGAIDGLADNLDNIKKAIKMSSLAATVRSGEVLATADSEIPEVAAVGGAKNAVDIPNYIYGSIEKNIYNLAMKAALGDDALKKRDVEKYMEAYFLSIGTAQESKKIISRIGNQMAESIHDYLGHEAGKEVDIDRFMLLSSASREIESEYGLANKSIDNRTIPFDIPAPPTSEKDNMYLQPKLPQSSSQPAALVAGSSGVLGNAPEAIATAAVLAAAVHAAKGIFKKSKNNEAVAAKDKKTAEKGRA